MWAAALALVRPLLRTEEPALVPLWYTLHGGLLFFGWFYGLLFMAGARLRSILMALWVTALLAGLALLEGTHAMDWADPATGLASPALRRNAGEAWLVPAAIHLAMIGVLALHVGWLGLGSRPAPPAGRVRSATPPPPGAAWADDTAAPRTDIDASGAGPGPAGPPAGYPTTPGAPGALAGGRATMLEPGDACDAPPPET